jgi:2-polyprenyl-6-methoxyphenol hydroxylase-like FAD-dependent oxidoreductase
MLRADMKGHEMMPRGNLRVLVVGGGIGGLAAAIGLRRAGIDVLVCERVARWRQAHLGGGLNIQINGMRGLQRLGVFDQVNAIATPLVRQEFWSFEGDWLGEWPCAAVAQTAGVPDVLVTRPGLHRVLVEAVGSESIRMDHDCTGYSQDETGVTAHFRNRTELRAHALIGADGARSTIRRQLLGTGEPKYAEYAVWRGYTTFAHPDVPDGVAKMYFGHEAWIAAYPAGRRQVGWLEMAKSPRGATVGAKSELLERHLGWPHPVEELIESTEDSTITRTDVAYYDPVNRWGARRVTLLGDAAHAMPNTLAQGASQSIEDAVVLARSLDGNGAVETALQAYEASRIARTTPIVNRSIDLGEMFVSRDRMSVTIHDPQAKKAMERYMTEFYEHDMTYDY